MTERLRAAPEKLTDLEIDICYYKAAAQYAAQDTEGALETYNAMIVMTGRTPTLTICADV